MGEGLATSPRPRYCFTSSALFSYSLVSLVSREVFLSLSRVQRLVNANMEVAFCDGVSLVEVLDRFERRLDAQISFLFMWQGVASTKPPSRVTRRGLIH